MRYVRFGGKTPVRWQLLLTFLFISFILLVIFSSGAKAQTMQPDIAPGETGSAAFAGGTKPLCALFVTSTASTNLLATCSSDGANWNTALRLARHLAKAAPATAEFNAKLCVVYVADNPTNDILITCSSNGVSWSRDVRLGVQAKFTPAVAVFNNKLCVAYVAAGERNAILTTCSEDGVNWPAPTALQHELSKTAPALAAFNGQLCLAFVADNPSNHLLLTCSRDGINYPYHIGVDSQRSRTAPALAVSNNKLCLGWIADNESFHILLQCTANPAQWSGNYLAGGHASDQPPALVKYGDQLCVGFKQAGKDGLFISCAKDDLNFGSARRIANQVATHSSKYAPSLVAFSTSVDAGAVVDSGFRPDPEGFNFPNYSDVLPTDFTWEDMRSIFGEAGVCSSVKNGVCVLTPVAQRWWTDWSNTMSGGHCYGMAVAASLLQRGTYYPAQLQANATTTHQLNQANVRRLIASYFVRQGARPASTALGQALTPVEVLARIQESFAYPIRDPLVLAIFDALPGRPEPRGHAITPYAVQNRGNGISWIRVYDNNWPGDASRYVEINTISNTWRYEFAPGDIWDDSMRLAPLSAHDAPMQCPFCANRSVFLNGSVQILVPGTMQSYVTDQQGRVVGQFGGETRNEIPGAEHATIIDGSGAAAPVLYSIPLTNTITTVLQGDNAAAANVTSISQFGPDFAVAVEEIPVSSSTSDHITVAIDGSAITYESNESKSVDVELALNHAAPVMRAAADGADGPDFRFAFSNLPIQSSVSLSVEESGRIVVQNRNGGSGTYAIELERVDDSGNLVFQHRAINLSAGDVQYLDFKGWGDAANGVNLVPIVLQVDAGGDGTVDVTTDLTNQTDQTHSLYLPFVTR